MKVLIHDGPRAGETVNVREVANGAPPSRLHLPVPTSFSIDALDLDPACQTLEIDVYEAARWVIPSWPQTEWRYRYVGRQA